MDMEDVRDALWGIYCRFVRTPVRYAKRVFAYMRFLWQEDIEEWDSVYMFKMWAFVLERHRRVIQGNKRHFYWKRDVRNMLICEECLKRLATIGDDRYESTKRFFGGRGYFDTCEFRFEPIVNSDLRRMVVLYDGVLETEEQKKRHRAETRASIAYDKALVKQLEELFCNTLRKQYKSWWD